MHVIYKLSEPRGRNTSEYMNFTRLPKTHHVTFNPGYDFSRQAHVVGVQGMSVGNEKESGASFVSKGVA